MLHEASKERVRAGGTNGEGLLRLFETLAEEAEECDLPMVDMIVAFIEENDTFGPGTYVPELHLIVRKVDEE